MKAISLFSGQGGLDLGVENAGFEVLHAVEFNQFACETLRQNRLIASLTSDGFESWFDQLLSQRSYKNWSEVDRSLLKRRLRVGVGKSSHFKNTNVVEADIRSLDPVDLMNSSRLRRGELDLIVGGPPCQSFSRSGKREAISDERGQLFLDFARFVNVLRPRWFIFENVKGILLTKSDVGASSCRECGLEFTPSYGEFFDHLASASPIPCPSCRSLDVQTHTKADVRGGAAEIIINEFERLGYRCHATVLNAANFGAPQSRERFFIVGSRDGEDYQFPFGEFGGQSVQQNLFERALPVRTVWDALFSQPNPYHHPEIDPSQAVLWVKNVVRPHDEPVTWSLGRPAPTIGAHQSAKLAIAPFGVPEEQLFRQQWHTLGRRQGDTPPVPVEHTYLSDEDLLALQTFPRHWFVAGTRMERAFQIGNAVPPVLAAAVAAEITAAMGLKKAA